MRFDFGDCQDILEDHNYFI